MLYSLDEICLMPNSYSDIEHRGDVIVYNNHNKLPLFSAPMACVIDEESASKFERAGINTIVPRNIPWQDRLEAIIDGFWVAVGLKEAQYIYEELADTFNPDTTIRLCIDQANGHMSSLYELCGKLKDKMGNKVRIMTGNIANPMAYDYCADAGIDYVRCSVGSGSCCTTSVLTGMHYPMGSLLIGCNNRRKEVLKNQAYGAKYRSIPKIVADGGFKRIDQIVKALALGADYVMLGEVLAKSKEACGHECYINNDGYIFRDVLHYPPTHREYFGMSTEKAQYLVNDASRFPVENFKPKHSEGQVRTVPIEYSIKEWVADFEHALRSSMSYANTRTLYGEFGFVGNVNYEYMTPVTYNAYMK